MSPPDTLASWNRGAVPIEPPARGGELRFATGLASLCAGLLTPFTVSVVGEMPVGELILIAVAGWVALEILVRRRWPCALLGSPLLWLMLGAQALAMGAYVFSDLYRGSSPHDIARGWGRMAFLGVDIVAMAYLAGSSPLNFVVYLVGQFTGDALHALLFGALFGDLWKFGLGVPLTYLLLALAVRGGAYLTVAAAFGLAILHLALDFRSFGGVCIIVGALTALQLLPRPLRPWIAPLALLACLGTFFLYQQIHVADAHRSTRSDVSRSSMMIAAWEGIERYPLSGNGSWFSNSNVWDNFMNIRQDRARLAHVGGFPEANEEPGSVAFHSQILVALAEGGIFGGTFFLVFGGLLVRALYRLAFAHDWNRLSPVIILVLATALWNLIFSPFSGAHRVYIAAACGILLLLQADHARILRAPGGARA